ncbi:MAG: hypothetical protein AB7G10_18830 [Reyranellaceae bacterium]
MLTADEAKRVVHGSNYPSRDLLCIVMAMEPVTPLSIQQLRERCVSIGLRKLSKRNLSDILGRSSGAVARTILGWELQAGGIDRVRNLAHDAHINLVVSHSSKSLRGHATSLADPITRSFVEEAISCFEAKQYRAAVVFSWAGAIALLHKHVFTTKLTDFNVEATRRDTKWRIAKQQDDLGRMKERDFLDVCEVIGVLGKNVKQLLQNECLTLRNACGHPSSVSIAENSVAAHIEKLIKNIFSRFT